jgi:GNAT superfamily N-acetyltransferase
VQILQASAVLAWVHLIGAGHNSRPPSIVTRCIMTKIEVHYLQMMSRDQLHARDCPSPHATVIEARVKLPELNRFLYTAVGGDWYWMDRLPWTHEQWSRAIGGDQHRTFVCYWKGTPAGYYELQKHDDGSVEILYFGLIPAFIGKGLGGWLLSHCIAEAWNWTTTRVWVHTCTLDHPSARANYEARGLVHYQTEVEYKELPAKSPGPWPNARG